MPAALACGRARAAVMQGPHPGSSLSNLSKALLQAAREIPGPQKELYRVQGAGYEGDRAAWERTIHLALSRRR